MRKNPLSRAASVLIALITLVVGLTASPTAATAAKRVHSATDLVAAMQPGWNLGNTLDAFPDETSWGNPLATKALFQKIRSEGFRSVRIPVTWTDHQSGTAPYTIDATWMNRVKEVVDLALASDLYVLINVHHDSWQWISKMPANHDEVVARFNASWTQIAAAFRDAPHKVLFESVNEPQFDNATDEEKMTLLAELNRSFHGIVRGSGGRNADRILVLPTVHTSADQKYLDSLYNEISALNDKNLAATIHFYGYWPFSVNIAGVTTFNEETQQELIGYFDRAALTFASRGIPVIVGEYGLLSFDVDWNAVQQGEKLKFFEMLGYQARAKKLTTMWWDNGQHLNRQTLGEWKDPGLFAQIKSSFTTRSGTTSSDSIFLPKSGAIEAQSLTLNKNGTYFRGLWHGASRLHPGRDYTVSGDKLTFTAAALTRLAGDRSHGVNATIEARFSSGIPWKIYVISYDTPVLSNATGTTESLAIPTRFNGDRVATMEAKYADGTNALPHDWTSYKEYGRSYSPSYENNSIRLLKELVSQMRENTPLTLTFHFWSGAKVTYQVTRSGDTVTGTTS
ncbi:cellulase [Nonomuraea turkmeniaca]|uniref:Cellulase n=1 Tax=Nonomuraea turkmeniaca TaxID=103838 RepID=A0A5S4FSS7_9ACTN|nr:cellulase family glycosylhydrolase [Nonomuraea turkmeniaca]TMR23729.1 cellulase [Nonomuraea turkmeniaca]